MIVLHQSGKQSKFVNCLGSRDLLDEYVDIQGAGLIILDTIFEPYS